ncbi:hypothetical protein KCP73_17750 [Salmonella enterica subsp. enterica]|nr:hypothetical protein KCP73_17750 [Salmonella enterica subsp. enterica]
MLGNARPEDFQRYPDPGGFAVALSVASARRAQARHHLIWHFRLVFRVAARPQRGFSVSNANSTNPR